MNVEKNDHMKNEGPWKAVYEAFNGEVPEHLEKELQKNLDAFRRDIREHPYVQRPQPHGFPLWRKFFFSSQPLFRPLLLSGAGLAVVVVIGFFVLGNKPPTWAEVAESFRRAGPRYATIYVKSYWSTPSRFEAWSGHGGRFRILCGDTVAFGLKGKYLKTYNLKDRVESKPDPNMQMILRGLDAVDKTNAGFIEGFFQAHSDGDVVDTTALVHPDPIFSKDLVVFDAKSKGLLFSIRLWALRESRLPIRIFFRGEAGNYIDVIIIYSKPQPERFYDPVEALSR